MKDFKKMKIAKVVALIIAWALGLSYVVYRLIKHFYPSVYIPTYYNSSAEVYNSEDYDMTGDYT